ncbi:phospholipase A2 inhibitor and Ly6/PLAUR domain-containing protein-like [Bufo gargarizans]|uniref:phospholipase A2 inhibitor and Ly6/PLAUR domain-containing protein-like n=1 Tax=Bufo gargarizans TaxID=30331 RepID=UPI001CF4A2A1|nr:phospholipase A2 inhibitor and Ly6/PLAUR domain-containing protein-like [Bufo gargarizans]
MRTFLAIVFIVSATIKAGNCVVCTECRNSTTADCVGNLVTCGTCMTIVNETMSKDGNSISYSVEKTCNLNANICNITYSVNSDQYQARYTVNCCNNDSCNQKSLEVTPWNNTKNGLECPTCYAEGEENCKAKATVQCTGDENTCLVFSGKDSREEICQTVAFQGCVSAPVCGGLRHLYPDNVQCPDNSTMICSNQRNATYEP